MIGLAALAGWMLSAAEPPIGSLVDPSPGAVTLGDIEARNAPERVSARLAECIARSHRRGAAEMLELPYDSREQSEALLRLLRSECLGQLGQHSLQLRTPRTSFAGRIAEGLLHGVDTEDAQRQLAGMTDEAADQAGLTGRNYVEYLSLCAIRRDPASVAVLLTTARNTPGEAAAARRIVPQFGPCIVSGHTFEFNVRALRAILAVGYYRAVTRLRAVPAISAR